MELACALANRWGLDALEAGERESVVEFIRVAWNKHSRIVDARIAITSLELLRVYSARSDETFDRLLTYWRELQMTYRFDQVYPDQAKRNRYCAIFLDIATSYLGHLPFDSSTGELKRRLTVTPPERKRVVDDWVAWGAQLPRALVASEGGPRVGADFVVLGKFLFADPLLEDGRFEQWRSAFDSRAGARLAGLWELLASSPTVPESLKRLLQAYGRRFEAGGDLEFTDGDSEG